MNVTSRLASITNLLEFVFITGLIVGVGFKKTTNEAQLSATKTPAASTNGKSNKPEKKENKNGIKNNTQQQKMQLSATSNRHPHTTPYLNPPIYQPPPPVEQLENEAVESHSFSSSTIFSKEPLVVDNQQANNIKQSSRNKRDPSSALSQRTISTPNLIAV